MIPVTKGSVMYCSSEAELTVKLKLTGYSDRSLMYEFFGNVIIFVVPPVTVPYLDIEP